MALLLCGAALSWAHDAPALWRALRLSAWILLSTVPVYRFMFVGSDLGGSRYTYLAEAGWALLLVHLLFSVAKLGRLGRIARWAIAAGMVLLSASALRAHLGVWQQATSLRDRVLESAVSVQARVGCSPITFEGVPESLRGAHVLLNGFPEALSLAYHDVPSVPHAPRARHRSCRFTYKQGRFERIR